MASGFHVCIRGNTQADPIHEEKQRKFKAAQRASSLTPWGSTPKLWMERGGLEMLWRCQQCIQTFKKQMSVKCMTSWLVRCSREQAWRLGVSTKQRSCYGYHRKLFSELPQRAFILLKSKKGSASYRGSALSAWQNILSENSCKEGKETNSWNFTGCPNFSIKIFASLGRLAQSRVWTSQ